MDVPPKINKNLWKAYNDGLPTKSILEQSHVFLPQQSIFCNYHSETATHLFFYCPFTRDVMQTLHEGFNWPLFPNSYIPNPLSFWSTLNLCLHASSKEQIHHPAMIWWFVWYFRNKIIFNNEFVTFRQASLGIFKFAANWSKARRLSYLPPVSPPRGVMVPAARCR